VTLGHPVQDRGRHLVTKRNALTRAALCEQMTPEYHTRVRVATMGRLLHRLGLPRKQRRAMRRNVIPPASSRRDGPLGSSAPP
jgi:hypothetical protein